MNYARRSFAVVLGLLAVDVVNVSAREETPFAAAVAKGDSLQNDEDFEAAVAAYSEAIQLNPNIAATYLGRGAAHKGRQQWDEAMADYKKAARLVHENREAYLALARVYYQLGKYRDAIIKYSVAIGLDPRDPEAYLDRAVVWRHADCLAPVPTATRRFLFIRRQSSLRETVSGHIRIAGAPRPREYQTCGDADWQRAIADFHDAALYAETDRDKSRAYFLLGSPIGIRISGMTPSGTLTSPYRSVPRIAKCSFPAAKPMRSRGSLIRRSRTLRRRSA